MKNKFLRKITAIALAIMMIFSIGACNTTSSSANNYPKNGAKKIITVEKDIYLPTGQSKEFNVAYYENEEEVLLIEINYAISELLMDFVLSMSEDSATVEETNTMVAITRNNGSYCEIDFVKDTIYFSDFDGFSSKNYDATPLDLLATKYINDDGQKEYFDRRTSFYTPGYAIELDLAERNIPLDIYKGKKYIPLQTFNDLFVCPYGTNIAYNGESLFVLNGSTVSDDVSSLYYSKEQTQRSTALTEFNYNELCLFLDLYYGLQNEHGFVDGFDYYLDNIGLKDEFLKPDATNSYNALVELTMGYIADLHSAVSGASPYVGAPSPSEESSFRPSSSIIDYMSARVDYSTARNDQLGEVEFYQKVGNTAFITFDAFTYERIGDYEVDAEQAGEDTFAIIRTAHQRIINDPEIENVVLDLSCNGGGAVDAAIYTVSWMLGFCDLSIYDGATYSKATTTYKADVNFDRVFDDNDDISNKNLYCLISPVSFSCGNLVPALLKASGKVTIMGKTSGGGGCMVRNGVTADGTLFAISNSYQFTTVKNGTYYGVDNGVEPDVHLSKIESFYDRDGLAEMINNLK